MLTADSMHIVHVLLELFECFFPLFRQRRIEFFFVPRHELEQFFELFVTLVHCSNGATLPYHSSFMISIKIATSCSTIQYHRRWRKSRLFRKFKCPNLHYENFSDGTVPFDVPESWSWTRFGNIVLNYDSQRRPIGVKNILIKISFIFRASESVFYTKCFTSVIYDRSHLSF